MDRRSLRRLALALLCGAAGFGLNSLPGTVLAPLMLGRAVTLPIAILFGPWLGLLSAVVLMLAALWLWRHNRRRGED